MSQAKLNQKEYIKESNLVLAQKGKTFFWAKFLLNQKHATQAVRLYRFCRHIDDVGDDNADHSLARHLLLQIIEELNVGRSSHPIISDAIALFHESQININIPIALVQGVMSDLDLVRIKDEAALMLYCYQVAGTVGLMMSKILDVKDQRAYAHAIDLGMAMQLTNICRDVAEDALMNRRYLPAALIGDIEPAALINPDEKTQDKIKNTLIKMLNNADTYYQSGHDGLCFLPNRARFGIVIASGLYRHIGTHLANNNYACWAFRSVVSKPLKAWLTVKILLLSLLDKSFYFYTKAHNHCLHDAINKVAYPNG